MRRLLTILVHALAAAFGQWSPPPWLRWVGRNIGHGGIWALAHKVKAACLIVAVAGASVGGTYGVRWWKARPKPAQVTVHVFEPGLTPIGEKATPRPLRVEFSASAAPLKAVGTPVKKGITVEPKIDGTWKWVSDHELELRPREDWPVGQQFSVRFDRKGLLASHVNLAKYDFEFSTAPFVARLRQAEFYQDPVDPNLKKIVSEFSFSHPVDGPSFEKSVKMLFQPTNKEERSFDLEAHISYDKWKARAFVHSTPFALPQKDAVVTLRLLPGSKAGRGGPAFDKPIEEKVKVPGLYNFFRVSSTQIQIVDNPRMEPEQILVMQLSTPATEKEIGKNFEAWLLPSKNPHDGSKHAYRWDNPESVDGEVLAKGKRLAPTQLPAEKEFASDHSFRFHADPGRFIYLRLKKGVQAFGGYLLGEDHQAVLEVPAFPRQVKMLHSGSLLALSGQRKVSVFVRDVPGLRFEVARVISDQIHHVFSFNNGSFSKPSLQYPITQEHLAEIEVETRPVTAPPGKPVYETLDLGKYLDSSGGQRRGLFFVKVESWSPETKQSMGELDARLVLVSDLGILSKEAGDGSHDVFVQSIQTGKPVAGAHVQVIGRNGQPVFGQNTDGEGHARLPSLRDLRQEKAPSMFLVTLGRDTSFLPYGRQDRLLDMSRFDVGGVTDSESNQGLSAYLFSERGLYRPGDEIHVAALVRSRDLNQILAGLPLEMVVNDARGLEVKRERFKLSAAGLEEFSHRTREESPTGNYTLSLYTVKDGHADSQIGSTSVTVREFLPDRMTIHSNFSVENPSGWVPPKGLEGRVSLANLFGTPAASRRIRAKLILTPGMPSFPSLREFHFHNPQKAIEPTEQQLPDGATDDSGQAKLALGLDRFADATYRLTLVTEGFEAEGGRSVTSEASTVVSPRPWLMGYKSDGDLQYVNKDAAREVELVAVGPKGNRVAAEKLQMVVLERRYISSLVRLENGTFRYQSMRKDVEVSRKPFALPAAGAHAKLPTDKAGDFVLSVQAGANEVVQEIPFTVAGFGNLARSLEKNAELQLALKNGDVAAGSEIEMQIKAPYTGNGLITIEREKVYAWKWFHTSETASVQKIKVPADLEGGGYVSVSFVRDSTSEEVFMSPLSYATVPFSISRGKRALNVKVETDDLVKPGDTLTMKVSANHKGRAVVFAVDEGILRVARYRAPDPLSYFLQKRALAVRTTQILDLILPELTKLRDAAAPGGDGQDAAVGANLNPFRRKRDKPVVFWSGIVEVGTQAKELTYTVPDHFNGTLRVMVVAASDLAMGAFDKRTVVRGDFVINPNAPTFAAPGDELDISVGLANNVVGSGRNAKPKLSLTTSSQVEIIGPHEIELPIGEMREGSAIFHVRARKELGSASLRFEAHLGDKHARLTADFSVRPSSPFVTTLQAGYLKNGDTTANIERRLFSEHRTLDAGIAAVPLSLAHGLATYLASFPHTCTEQLVSQAAPAVVLGKRPEFGFDKAKSESTIANLVDVLRSRQNEEGGFGLWTANPKSATVPTVWALHLLTEARERGHAISAELMKNGTRYLEVLASETPDDLADARIRAHALYVLARNGVKVGRHAAALQHWLETNAGKTWREELPSAYLGATYAILKQDSLAGDIASAIKFGAKHETDYEHYYDGLGHDAQALLLVARHFPKRAATVSKEDLDGIVAAISGGSYNTFSSALSILALEAFASVAAEPGATTRSLHEVVQGNKQALALSGGLLPHGSFSDKATALVFGSHGDFGSYWSLSQSGFDIEPATKAMSNKLEIVHEFLDDKDKPIGKVGLGDEISVRIRVRALHELLWNVAVVDLLPAGFEVVMQTSAQGAGSEEGGESHAPSGEVAPSEGEENEGQGESESEGQETDDREAPSGTGGTGLLTIALPGSDFSPDYIDVREDRVVLYGSIGKEMSTFIYKIKATNSGKVVTPAIHAESMYDRSVRARGEPGTMTITRP
ncbi:MAG TPA: MG2 domain-containing protein [Polyangia bacterium]